jgi:hypothetical protein
MFRTVCGSLSVSKLVFITCPSCVVKWYFSLLFKIRRIKIALLVRERAVFTTRRLQYNIQDQASSTYFIPLRISPISGHRPTVRDLETFSYSENSCFTLISNLTKAPYIITSETKRRMINCTPQPN